jgi:hypothetical protein
MSGRTEQEFGNFRKWSLKELVEKERSWRTDASPSGLIEHFRRFDQYWPIFAAAIAVFMVVSGQAIYGFIEHDDYEWLLAPGESGNSPWGKTLSEGRWINWLWSLVSPNLTPALASVLLILLFSIVCWLAVEVVTKHRASVLAALTLLFAPMLANLSLWPTTLVPSVMLMTVGIALFSRNHSFSFDLATLAVCTYLQIFAFPPLAMVLVVVFAAKYGTAAWKLLLVAALTVAASYALAILTIFTLNLFAHGYFGVQIGSWRHPRSPHSLADLHANIGSYMMFWAGLWKYMPIPLLASAAAFLIALLWRETTRVSIVLVLATAFAASVDIAISLSTGVSIPQRSVLWLWFAMCVPAVMLLKQRNTLLVTIGAATLVLNLVTGLPHWWRTYSSGVAFIRAEEQLAHDIQGALALTDGSSVVWYGNPKADPRFRHIFDKDNFRWSLLKRFGLRIEECEPEFCRRIEETAPHTMVSRLEGRVVVVFPRKP